MRNYYRTLGLPLEAGGAELERRIGELADLEPALAEKAADIVLNPVRRAVYDNLHSQYEAIAHAHQVYSREGMLDTNDWHLRLVEFYGESVPPPAPATKGLTEAAADATLEFN